MKPKNNIHNNSNVPLLTQLIAQWHHKRNLIDGATDWSQTGKLLEEFVELVAAQMPTTTAPEDIHGEVSLMLDGLLVNGRIKPRLVNQSRLDAITDAIGDMAVVAINITERNNTTYAQCIKGAYNEIKHRKGKMVNGTFVKESDL